MPQKQPARVKPGEPGQSKTLSGIATQEKGLFEMDTLWIVVAQRSQATIFERRPGNRFDPIHEFNNPEGRMKDQEIASDRHGRTFSSVGEKRHGHSAPMSPSQQITIDFSKEIASFLDGSRKQNRFGSLIVIASPELLGLLRQDLGKPTYDAVIKTVDKNLGSLSEPDLQDYLRAVVSDTADVGSRFRQSA